MNNTLPWIAWRSPRARFCLGVLFVFCSWSRPSPASPARWTDVVRIDPAHPHHFVRADGSHFFLFNKTAWHYFSAAHPEITLERANRLGVTLIRVHLEGAIYPSLGFDAWPWGGTRAAPDFSTFNEAYWDKVEARIRLAAEKGIGINLTLFQSIRRQDSPDAFATFKPYLERVIARLARHPNIFCWEIQNEHVANPKFQDEVGRFLQAHDPQRRPVITSDGTTDSPIWPELPWMGFALVHHCTGSIPQYDLRDWYLGIARNLRVHGKPAVNNETGREGRHKNDDPVHRRKQLWIAAAAGGYTTWHSWDGCEGIDDAHYVAPGEQFVRPFADWWKAEEFWRVDPVFTVVQLPNDAPLRDELVPVALASPDRDRVLAYFFTRHGATRVTAAQIKLRLPDGAYRIEYFRPADGAPVGEVAGMKSPGLRQQTEVALPPFTDDLAMRIVRTYTPPTKTLIPGTK